MKLKQSMNQPLVYNNICPNNICPKLKKHLYCISKDQGRCMFLWGFFLIDLNMLGSFAHRCHTLPPQVFFLERKGDQWRRQEEQWGEEWGIKEENRGLMGLLYNSERIDKIPEHLNMLIHVSSKE